MTKVTPNDVKNIVIDDLKSVDEADAALGALYEARAKIQGQLDHATEGGTIKLEDFERDDIKWFLGAKSALRFVKMNLRKVLLRRESIIHGANKTLKSFRSYLEEETGCNSEHIELMFSPTEARALSASLDTLLAPRESLSTPVDKINLEE